MLLVPAVRIVALLLLLGALIDAAIQSSFRGDWWIELWDKEADLPAGYFTLVRLVVSLSAAWDAWAHSRYARAGMPGANAWAFLLVLVVLIFQPIFPLHLEYRWWVWIDLTVFGLLACHAYIVSRPIGMLMASAMSRGENPLSVSGHMAEAATAMGYVSAATLFARIPSGDAAVLKPNNPASVLNGPTVAPVPEPSLDAGNPTEHPSASKLRVSSPSDGPNVDNRSLAEQIAAHVAMIRSAEHKLSEPNLSAKQRWYLERARDGGEMLLRNKLARLDGERNKRDKD